MVLIIALTLSGLVVSFFNGKTCDKSVPPEPPAQKDIHSRHFKELWTNVSIKRNVLLASPTGLLSSSFQVLKTQALLLSHYYYYCADGPRHKKQVSAKEKILKSRHC